MKVIVSSLLTIRLLQGIVNRKVFIVDMRGKKDQMESGRVQNRERKLKTKHGQQTGFGHENREKREEQEMKRNIGQERIKERDKREHHLHSRVIRRMSSW